MPAQEMLQAHNGIARFELYWRGQDIGHTMCIHYQPDTKTFQIIDPNVGFFQLPSKKFFFECLSDLLILRYGGPGSVALTCFHPKK